MQAGSRWKFFRRRLRYWLDHGERQRLLWAEMEFHIESMAEELVAQGMSEQEARAAKSSSIRASGILGRAGHPAGWRF